MFLQARLRALFSSPLVRGFGLWFSKKEKEFWAFGDVTRDFVRGHLSETYDPVAGGWRLGSLQGNGSTLQPSEVWSRRPSVAPVVQAFDVVACRWRHHVLVAATHKF